MRHIPYIRKILRPIYGSNEDRCTIDVLDFATLSVGRKNSTTPWSTRDNLTIVASILRSKSKSDDDEEPICSTLFVFWLERYEAVVKDLLLTKTTQLKNLDFVYTQSSDRTSKTILKGELWSLCHHNSVISASWKKNCNAPTPIHKLFLVTLTKKYMAYIWRFNEMKDSFEISIQVALQNVNYNLNFQCLWMSIESEVMDYNFSSRAFIIFYNTTMASHYSIVTNEEDGSDGPNLNLNVEEDARHSYLSDYFNRLDLNSDFNDCLWETDHEQGKEDDEESTAGSQDENIVFGRYGDYVQYFEIYGIDGLYNYQLAVTSEYILGSNEIMMPIKIKSIESVVMCNHTFETGLVTLYTSETLRPNKITTKFPISVSKWITLKSTNLNNFYSSMANRESSLTGSDLGSDNTTAKEEESGYNEVLDELIGMQISKGLNKIIPPIILNVLNENDITVNLLLSPYDLFLKDEHIKESVDNIVGLVIRYMFHPSTPLYLKVNEEFVYIENYFISKIKSSKKVKNVKVFSDKDETLYIMHSFNGTLSALTSKKHDPNDITYHKIHNLQFVSTFQVVEYHHQLYFIVFSPHGMESSREYGNRESQSRKEYDHGMVEDRGLYNCGFYKWENYKLNMKGQWLFKSPYVQQDNSFRRSSETVHDADPDKTGGSSHSPRFKSSAKPNASNTTHTTTTTTQHSSGLKRAVYDHNSSDAASQLNLEKSNRHKAEEIARQFSDDDPYTKFSTSVMSAQKNGNRMLGQNDVNHQLNRSRVDRTYMDSSWSDHQDEKVADAVLQFKKWCDSNYFCLLSKFKLISECPEEDNCDDNEGSSPQDVIYLYLIRRHKIVKWMEINENYYYDFLTKNKYFLMNHEGGKEYTLGDLKILIKGRNVSDELSESERMLLAEENEILDELPLFMGCHFKNKMYPVYHPECVLTIYKLGLNNIASKLINMLVFVYRKILNQLNNDVYCINSDPYDNSPGDSRDSGDPEEMGEYGVSSCNCIIFKTLSLKLFCKFNRFFFDYVVKSLYTTTTHTSHIGFSPITNLYSDDKEVDEAKKKNILYDYVVDDEFNEYFNEYSNFMQDDELLVKELIVYLQVIRLIGLTWYEQYQLINVLIKYTSREENLLIFNTDNDMDSFVGTVGTSDEEEDVSEESCNLCVNSKVVLKIGMEQTSNKLAADNNVLNSLVLYLASLSGTSSYYNTNRSAAELETVFLNKYKEYLRTRYDDKRQLFRNNPLISSGEEEYDEDNSLIWLLLIKNDHHLFVELSEYYKKVLEPSGGKNEEHTVDYMEYLEEVNVGYWIKNKATFNLLFETAEKYFRLKLKGYKNIEDFDQFGFYLILQGKVKIYSMLLKTKGFEKFANFLTNDFSLERWKDASVKNAFALISQRRYLLSSAMLILANRVQDAIDVIHQYLGSMSLCIFLAKLYEFDLGYVFRKIQNRKVKYVLLHTHSVEVPQSGCYLGSSSGSGLESGTGPEKATEEEELSKEVEQLCNQEMTRVGMASEPDREINLLELLDGDVDELILNVSIGIVLKSLEMHDVEKMIRRSSQYYLDKTPIISVLLHSLLNSYTSWDKLLIYAANFLHFQKFDNFNEHDYLDYSNQSFTESYCNNYYYADDYKYLDGNVLVEFNNFEFKRPHSKCPILRTLSSIIPSMYSSKQIKYSYHSSSMVSMSSTHTNQYGSQSLEDAEGEYMTKETGYMGSESDLIVNVNTLSVVESLLKIKSNLNMELTLTYYKINSNISIRNYDLDIESVYTRLVNTFIGFLDSDLQVENLNIPSLLMNLIHKLSLLTIYSSNLNNSDDITPMAFDNQDEMEAKIDSSNRLNVGLYDSDLKLVNDEIVCVCFLVSLSCIFVLMMYKVDILPQVYNGLYTQLTLLNQMKGNSEWLAQFLESVVKTIEPSLFTNNIYNIDKLNIVIERAMENSRRVDADHMGICNGDELDEFIGVIMTLSILETILGLMRNYIYKQTNYHHYFWLDRLSVSISKYLFNYRDQMIKLSLRSSDTLYNLNYQYLKVDSPRNKVLKDSTKYSDHEDIVNNYLLSRYNNSFYKLWSYLNCSHKLYSIYSCNHNFNPYGAKVNGNGDGDPNKEEKYYDEEDDYNELYNIVENYQIINCDNLMIPLIVPMRLFFYKLYYYSNHQLYLNNSTSTYTQPKDAKSKEKNKEELETDILMKKIIDNLRKIRFISLHNAKGRTMSTFYTMPNITMNDHVSHLSLQLLVDPIKSDLYLLTELNTRLSLHQLNSKMTSSVVNLLVDYNNGSSQQQREQPGENNWIILLKFLKYLDRYSTTFIEEIFHIKKSNLRISYSLQKLFRNRETTSNSGGIAPHPVWPLYAIVHGSTAEKATPSYTVSLQHSRVLSNEFKYTKNNILLNNLINIVNVTSLQLTTFHSNNLFGDLLYIDWSGDSLCIYDKYGWLMVYYMRNLLYKNVNAVSGKVGKQVNDIIPSASIPTISFKTHFASYYMSWLGEYFILTMGYGILKESIEQDIVYINMSFKEEVEEAQVPEEYAEAENGQLKLAGSQFSNGLNGYAGQISYEDPRNGNETASYGAVHKCAGREAVSLQGLEGFCESSVPCICIWNLVEYNNNNIPKIDVLFSFESVGGGSNASVGAVGVGRDTPMEESLRVTSVLKIKNRNIRHGSKEVGLEYDLLLFDSTGVMRVFSVSDMDVVFCCSLDESAIVASFLLGNGNFAVVTEDGKIKVFKLTRPRAVPALIFETSSKVVEPKEIVSQSSLVTTIGEFISQRFTREKPQPAQQQIKIVSVRLYSAQFITIVYSDEQVSTTRLPDFAVY